MPDPAFKPLTADEMTLAAGLLPEDATKDTSPQAAARHVLGTLGYVMVGLAEAKANGVMEGNAYLTRLYDLFDPAAMTFELP